MLSLNLSHHSAELNESNTKEELEQSLEGFSRFSEQISEKLRTAAMILEEHQIENQPVLELVLAIERNHVQDETIANAQVALEKARVLTERTLVSLQKVRRNVEERPIWDKKKKELTFRGVVVRKFKQPAKNCFAILDAFEDAEWKTTVDCPLRGATKQDRAQAIQSLKKRLHESICFGSNGSADGYKWWAC